MIATLLIIMILGSGYPSFKNTISTIAWGRLSSITLIFAACLILNTLYTSRIGAGLTLFSGFFKINLINQSIEIIMLIIAGLILISVINTNNKSININYIPENNYSVNSLSELEKKSIQQINSFKKVLFSWIHLHSQWIDNYFLIILFNLIGACCLMTSNDLLTLYITIELQSFSLYILSTLNKDSINSASAGLKYFLIGSLASALILIGIAFFYLLTGLTNFESLYIFFNITDYISSGALYTQFTTYNLWNFDFNNINSSLIIIAFLFILIGAFIKIGAAPFHQWTPDVYDQVPTKVTIWLVIIPKLSIFILLLSILDMVIGIGNISAMSSIATIVVGGIEGWSGLKGISWENYYYITDYIMHLFLFKILDKFGHADFFNINYDLIGWMNYYRTEIPTITTINYGINGENTTSILGGAWGNNYLFLPNDMGNYWYYFHNSLFLNYFIPTIQEELIKNILIFIALISLIIGAISGLYQIKIKRLLAFSAVNHVGFLILALAINTKTGLESFVFYLTQYSITNLNLFLILIAFGYLSYNYFNKNKIESLSEYSEIPKTLSLKKDLNFIFQLKDLFKNNSLLTISFAITLFSFAGIPPLLGFYGKMQVLYSSISVGFIFISIIAINMSVISAYYYLNLIQVSNFIKTNLKSDLIKSVALLKLAPTQNIIIESLQSQKNKNYSIYNSNFINNSHSYFISIITLIILLFTFKTDLLFNFTSLLTSYSYYI